MKRLITLIIVSFISFGLFAQNKKTSKEDRKEERRERINAMIKQEEEGALIYAKQNAFGIQLRTNGYGAFYELGKMKTRRKTNLYTVDLAEIKDPKEEKVPTTASFFSIANPYIFGKINNFYPLKLGFGQQYLLGQKGNKNGVAVTAIYHGGISLGLLRPYYLEIDDTSASGSKKIRYTTEDSSDFTNQSIIRGSGGIGTGWGQIKFKPGIYAKGALRFDYGRYNEMVSAVEIGLSVEVYSSKIPILLYAKQRQIFFQGHIAIVFGRRK